MQDDKIGQDPQHPVFRYRASPATRGIAKDGMVPALVRTALWCGLKLCGWLLMVRGSKGNRPKGTVSISEGLQRDLCIQICLTMVRFQGVGMEVSNGGSPKSSKTILVLKPMVFGDSPLKKQMSSQSSYFPKHQQPRCSISRLESSKVVDINGTIIEGKVLLRPPNWVWTLQSDVNSGLQKGRVPFFVWEVHLFLCMI